MISSRDAPIASDDDPPLLFFTEMHPSAGSAKDGVAKFDHRALSDSLLRGIGNRVRNRILNWDL